MEHQELESPFQINPNKSRLSRIISRNDDELHEFRSWLRLICVDQSTKTTTFLSWTVFIIFAIIVPCISHFFIPCSNCDSKHTLPFDTVVQLSLTAITTISFICLTRFISKFGLRRFLFIDKLCNESETVRRKYTGELNRSFKILFIFLLPCFTVECAYKIWWYASGVNEIPFLGNAIVSNIVACIVELCSWLYRTVVFFLVCILFRLICCLQILRLQGFAKVFQIDSSEVELVLKEHLRIRRYLKIISHRYRLFIVLVLLIVTVSQFASLLLTTRSESEVNIYKAGEIALCSINLLTGLIIILRSATRITHKAQEVTSLAAKWHVCSTIDSYENVESETPVANINHNPPLSRGSSEDDDDEEFDEDDLDNTMMIPAYARSTISFQKREALVTYFDNNRAGISLYGYVLDRGSLHTIFGIELSLVLWLLGKTIASV
ncbi:uncharacterized protein LOC124910629 [Impatiens glandulifera]|uniref:uncharacterized protein LOC124910629 n=1 Tax=Impatiens glandulifera TaxID=253017 RepID=UPI001FB0A748|nr:uncharacterized protein LOC124910629 [Impatiens glandulifera]XP_047307256.1 uncharacterized protein LOC124910629 [Impatiens glandulifera]